MVNDVFLGLGSNKGDRLKYIQSAIRVIETNKNCKVKSRSSIYETEPYGETNQENFLNTVFRIETNYSLQDLLNLLKEIEIQIGRTESYKWGPREIDIDILFFNDLIYEDDFIWVPHKDLIKRNFVVTPLLEIAAGIIHPVYKKKLSEIVGEELENQKINKYEFQLVNKLDETVE